MDQSHQWPAMVSLLKARRRSLHATITPAFGLSLVLFFLVASLAYKSTNRLAATGEHVAEAKEVLARLATASTFVERAESEHHEYLLTGDSAHLDAMQVDITQANEELHSIRDSKSISSDQRQSMARLDKLLAAEFERIGTANELRASNGLEDVVAELHQHPENSIGAIRDLFEQMRAEASVSLRDESAHAASDLHYRDWTFIWMAGAVLLAVAFSYAIVLEYEAHCRRSEKELHGAKQAAESANQFKSSFLASMSHEIRTPMTAIIGFADLLARPNLAEQDRLEYVQTVRQNGVHLLNLVNDILDLSKIEAGKMEVEKISTSPAQVVDDVVRLLRPRATEKQLALDVQYIGPCPEAIQSDPTRLRQVLTNLIANALKFTERGSIRMFVQLAAATDGVSRMQFRITDTGPGMTPEQVKSLFQPFKQAEASTTRKFGGTGLGLTIAKTFTQMLGGDITVSSQPGAGTTFVVEIATGPLDAVRLIDKPQEIVKRTPEPAASAAPNVRFNGRILLAEDGLTNQQLICLYLREAGADVTVADNGRIACEKVEAAAKAGTPFHLVLMDMEMPEMDGCEATRHLRNHGFKVPVVALTANAMSADRDQCMTAGCNAFATKPIDWPRLLDLVSSYLRNMDVTGSKQDDPFLARVLQTFMLELEQVEANLIKAVENQDRDRLAKLAHALKGTAGNCGFTTLSQVANDVAHAARGTMAPEAVYNQARILIETVNRSRTPRVAA